MDVRCQKCGIEYEFDDAKVTSAGVTVKCTSCGHVFKVKRDDPMAQFGPGASMSGASLPRAATATTLPPVNPTGDGEWMVRQASGTVFRFKELTTLQKWIVERKVGRDDEISKTGRSWKKLGEIAELASFFQVVEAANAALSASLGAVAPAMTPASMAAAAAQIAAPPDTSPDAQSLQVVHQHVTGGTQVNMPAVGNLVAAQAAAAAQGAVQGAPAATPTAPPAHLARAPDAQPPPPAAQPQVKLADTTPHAAAPGPAKGRSGAQKRVAVEELDDDDPVAEWGRARRRNMVLVAALLTLVVAGGVVFVIKPPWLQALLAGGAPQTVSGLEDGKKALRSDEPGELTAAIKSLADPTLGAPAQAMSARLWCALAAHAREIERLHELLRVLEPAQAAAHDAAADKANQGAADALGKAYATLNDVRGKAPNGVDVHLAAAAYNLEKGGFAEMRADLESARAAAKVDAKLSIEVDSEIAVAQAIADARQALAATEPATLNGAAEKVPVSTDARLRYAKAALVVTAAARAKEKGPLTDADAAALKQVALDVGGERANLLKQIVALTTAPPPVVDAGVAVAVAVDAGSAASADAGPAAAPAEPETYETLMAKAERARITDRPAAARDAFNKALKLRPGSARAWMGLGWASLDLDKKGDAVKAFKKALAIDDGLADAHFGLAEALRFSGQKDQALDEYKTYLKMDPTGKDASIAKNAIESLQ